MKTGFPIRENEPTNDNGCSASVHGVKLDTGVLKIKRVQTSERIISQDLHYSNRERQIRTLRLKKKAELLLGDTAHIRNYEDNICATAFSLRRKPLQTRLDPSD